MVHDAPRGRLRSTLPSPSGRRHPAVIARWARRPAGSLMTQGFFAAHGLVAAQGFLAAHGFAAPVADGLKPLWTCLT
jgi:hypothetical protein